MSTKRICRKINVPVQIYKFNHRVPQSLVTELHKVFLFNDECLIFNGECLMMNCKL